MEEKEQQIRREILEGMPVVLGPWEINAHVETRPRAPSCRQDPPIEPGDLWYRIVITIEDNTEGYGWGSPGAGGELSTSWCWTLDSAVESVSRLKRLELAWTEEDEEEREIARVAFVEFKPLAEIAVIRFQVASEPVSPRA